MREVNRRTDRRILKIFFARVDFCSPKSLSQNTAQFPNSFLNNMELYHSTEQPLNVNR